MKYLVMAFKSLSDYLLSQLARLSTGLPVKLQYCSDKKVRHYVCMEGLLVLTDICEFVCFQSHSYVAMCQTLDDVHHDSSAVHGFLSGRLVQEQSLKTKMKEASITHRSNNKNPIVY